MEISYSDELSQGDLIVDCPIPLPSYGVYQELKQIETKFGQTTDIEEPVDIQQANIIIMTQAFDIEQDKVDSLIVCPVWTLSELAEADQYFNSSKAREQLRQGKEPAWHLINEYQSKNIELPLSVVEFHRLYALPKEYVRAVAENAVSRLRLLPPYREHLSQAFARYFMRVGLPIDISRERVKNYY
jgi:hypothetical protein